MGSRCLRKRCCFQRCQPIFAWTAIHGPNCLQVIFGTFPFSGKNGLLAAISANVCLVNSQSDFGLEAAWFRVLHTLRSTKSTTASWDLNMASSLGAPTFPWCTVLTLRPVMCGGRRPCVSVKNTFGGWCVEIREKTFRSSPNGKKNDFWPDLTEDHRTTQATSHAVGHRSRWTLQRYHLHSCDFVRNEEQWSWAVFISRSKVNRGWWTMLIEA